MNFGVVLLLFQVCSCWRSASLPSWDVSCLGSEGLLMPRLIFLREILSTRSLGNGLHERANRNHSCGPAYAFRDYIEKGHILSTSN